MWYRKSSLVTLPNFEKTWRRAYLWDLLSSSNKNKLCGLLVYSVIKVSDI